MTIDGISPNRVVRPESIEELSRVIRDSQGSVIPLGSGTQQEFGNPLRSADTVVDLTRLNRVTSYNPADLTVHVEAGVTLGQLQRLLAENNQVLPLDPWNGPTATIGGIAAVNAQGPLRPTGSIRSWIIGMRIVHADGRISKTGGRVVKNVTGYDLAKLYTGSLGTLAVIAEISLKLRSSYAKTATAIAEFERVPDAIAMVRQIDDSPLQPICCEVAGPNAAVWVRFGEHPRAVDWQVANLPTANWKVVEGDEEVSHWETFRERYQALGSVLVRTIATPSTIGEVLDTFRPAAWIAHAANGIVLMTVSGPDEIRRVREKFPTVIERAPLDVRRQISTFGVRATELRLMKEMKQALDPGGRLNPGRHADGE